MYEADCDGLARLGRAGVTHALVRSPWRRNAPGAVSTEEKLRRPTLGELIKAGKESYFIVSQFNVFEYKKEAALFTRLSEQFERYILGLALVREEMGKRFLFGGTFAHFARPEWMFPSGYNSKAATRRRMP